MEMETAGQPVDEIVEATDEELDRIIADDDSDEGPTEEEAASEVTEEKSAEQSPEQVLGEDSPPSEPPRQQAQPQRQPTMEEHQLLLRQLEQTRLFAARRSTEIGDLRKQLREANQRLGQDLNEVMQDNPVEGTQRLLKIQDNERRLETLAQEEGRVQHIAETQQIFFKHVKPDEVSLDDMCETLQRDNCPPHILQQFRQNPFAATQPETLVHLAKRAQVEKLLQASVGVLKTQDARIKELEAQLKSKPKQVIDGVKRAIRTTPQVTGASGKSVSKESTRQLNPALMSDAELDEFLASHK